HGQATGHDGVDGEFFSGNGLRPHRLDPQQLVRRHAHPIETRRDRRRRRWHDREAVGPAIGVKQLLRGREIGNVVELRGQQRVAGKLHVWSTLKYSPRQLGGAPRWLSTGASQTAARPSFLWAAADDRRWGWGRPVLPKMVPPPGSTAVPVSLDAPAIGR